MSEAFYSFVRGSTDVVPPGCTASGMAVYRYLTFLGASQMIEAHYPQMRAQLGESHWKSLLQDFVRQSKWTSHFYGDLKDEFVEYLAQQSQT